MGRHHTLPFVILVIAITGSTRTAQTQTIVTGRIIGTAESKAYLRKDQETIAAVITNDQFKFSIPLENESVYDFLCGNNEIEIYLEPGDELNIQASESNFYSTLQFSGKHALENQFCLQRDLKRSQVYNPILQRLRKREESKFLTGLDSILECMRKDLTDFSKATSGVSKKFEFIEEVNRKFIGINQRGVYSGNYASNHPSSPVIDPHFSDYLDTLKYEDPRYLRSPRFKDFIRNHRYNTLDKLIQEKPELKDERSGHIHAMFIVINKLFKNQAIKDYALYTSLKYELRQHGLDIPVQVVNEFYATCRNQNYISDIEANYYTWTTLAAGKPAPSFNLNDDKGNAISIHSFNGKLVYIDVWATWCGPCIAEMPHLDSLIRAYGQSKNIAFLKVSLDVNVKPWLKSLKSQPNVFNLRAEEGANSSFAKAYAIKDIPRYILIDASGKIINVNAPAPSSPELKRSLDRLIATLK